MSAFRWIFLLTFRQLLQRRRALGLAALASIPAVVLALAASSISDRRALELYHELTIGILMAAALPVAALVNGAAALGEERRGHTLPYLVVKPIPRGLVAAATTAAALAATLVIGGVGVVLGWGVGAWAAGEVGIGWPALVGAAVASAGYVAVFVPLGMLTGRATLTGLVYIFLWEGILASAASALSASSLWRTGLSAYASLTRLPAGMSDALGNVSAGTWGAAAKAAVLLAVSGLLTTWLLRTRDLA